jgi:hypothetical protein
MIHCLPWKATEQMGCCIIIPFRQPTHKGLRQGGIQARQGPFNRNMSMLLRASTTFISSRGVRRGNEQPTQTQEHALRTRTHLSYSDIVLLYMRDTERVIIDRQGSRQTRVFPAEDCRTTLLDPIRSVLARLSQALKCGWPEFCGACPELSSINSRQAHPGAAMQKVAVLRTQSASCQLLTEHYY